MKRKLLITGGSGFVAFHIICKALQEGFEAFQQVWGKRPNPPVIASFFVAALANPDYLLGIEAVAVL